MARRGSQAMKVPRATRAVVAASVAGGAFTLFVAAWRQSASGHVDEGQWIVAAAMGALALGSWVWPVVVYRGGESEAFNMDEGFFVILALLVPPLVTLGTFALATVLAQVARRRPAGQVGLQYRASSDRGGSGTGCEPRYRCSLEFPHRRSDCSRHARGGSVLRHQYVSRGRRCGLDGHDLEESSPAIFRSR